MMTITYSNTYLTMTGELQKSGSLFETDYHMNREEGDDAGRMFPSTRAWIAALDAETVRRAPWFRKHHKLSVEESSVVWVQSAGHYMEIRRGPQTKFAATERRHWLTVEEWLQHCQPKIKEAEVAAAPVVVVSEVPAVVPVTEAAFNPEKVKKGFDAIMGWIRKNATEREKVTGTIQLCTWLLKMKALSAASTSRADGRSDLTAWLEETPVWYISIRAVIQALEQPESKAVIAEFLEKF